MIRIFRGCWHFKNSFYSINLVWDCDEITIKLPFLTGYHVSAGFVNKVEVVLDIVCNNTQNNKCLVLLWLWATLQGLLLKSVSGR